MVPLRPLAFVWPSAAIYWAVFFCAFLMNVEERALLTVIGQPHRDFMRTRKRLIPFIY